MPRYDRNRQRLARRIAAEQGIPYTHALQQVARTDAGSVGSSAPPAQKAPSRSAKASDSGMPAQETEKLTFADFARPGSRVSKAFFGTTVVSFDNGWQLSVSNAKGGYSFIAQHDRNAGIPEAQNKDLVWGGADTGQPARHIMWLLDEMAADRFDQGSSVPSASDCARQEHAPLKLVGSNEAAPDTREKAECLNPLDLERLGAEVRSSPFGHRVFFDNGWMLSIIARAGNRFELGATRGSGAMLHWSGGKTIAPDQPLSHIMWLLDEMATNRLDSGLPLPEYAPVGDGTLDDNGTNGLPDPAVSAEQTLLQRAVLPGATEEEHRLQSVIGYRHGGIPENLEALSGVTRFILGSRRPGAPRTLGLWGAPGAGKSYLAHAVAMAFQNRHYAIGRSLQPADLRQMRQDAKATEAEAEEESINRVGGHIRRLAEAGLLLLDDLGAQYFEDRDAMESLYSVLHLRSELDTDDSRVTIYTTNFSPEELRRWFLGYGELGERTLHLLMQEPGDSIAHELKPAGSASEVKA